MHETLIDRETLGQFVDEIIKQKYPTGQPAEALAKFREPAIAVLDDRIGTALFGNLSLAAHDEIDELLKDPNTPPETFQAFFDKYHINPTQIITDQFAQFKNEILGGNQNGQ